MGLEPGWGWRNGAESGLGRDFGPGKLGLGRRDREMGTEGVTRVREEKAVGMI